MLSTTWQTHHQLFVNDVTSLVSFDVLTIAFTSSMAGVLLLFLLLILFFSLSSSTPRVLSFSTITHLPGFDGPLPFHLETGYVSLDESNDDQLFYYFFKSERNPSEDPLLLWLNGGPGCSVLSALAFENGPLEFRKEELDRGIPTLVLKPYSWTKVCNIIFLDSPTGTGFSFSRRLDGYTNTDTSSAKQAHQFLRKWLMEHSEFLSNPLYIGGESYAGKIVPLVAHSIIEDVNAGRVPILNLQGYLIGNPVTGERCDDNSRLVHARALWIISSDIFETTSVACEGQSIKSPNTVYCRSEVEKFKNVLSEIKNVHVLEPKCAYETALLLNSDVNGRFLDDYSYSVLSDPPIAPPMYCRAYSYYLGYHWANSDVTREALHVQNGSIGEWQRCNLKVKSYYTPDILSSVPYHLRLINSGLRVLVYSGDHDLVVSVVGTKEWITSLNLSITSNWRSWWVDDQVAGYTMTYSKDLTFATVKVVNDVTPILGGGHTAPEYMPKECFAMFNRWVLSAPL